MRSFSRDLLAEFLCIVLNNIFNPGRLQIIHFTVAKITEVIFINKNPNIVVTSRIYIFQYRFTCRSVEYNYVTLQCHLSDSDRRTTGQYVQFVDAQGVDYFENLCLKGIL